MQELQGWMEFYTAEPFGYSMENYRTGITASVIANVHRGKNTRSYQPEDFMPRPRHKYQSWQEQYQVVKVLNELFHGENRRMS
ncbi:hypothetical protein ATHL_01996 [Anaerolinea thermolimosa]|uniref:phage tail assembly protein T n=1 Tax=Anaerolinea thermolimosa TaxID=229919 RepID=UPI0007850D9E|nr:hypothetical protein [Anaerolinea thermolimosa]GAP07128.1 hypothetical protein ATHL_01996 [Anaerolinea thermolimosa]